MQADVTAPERDRNGRWVAGSKSDHCLNPHGRPLGARTKLSDAFLTDMLAAWQRHGTQAIETFVQDRPQDFVKLVATILPRHFNIKVNELDELTDEQLDRQHAALCAAIEAAEAAERAAAAQTAAPQPVALLPALSETG